MFKKKIPWMILFIVIAALSIWAVVSQTSSFNLHELIHDIKEANKIYILLAGVGMFGFIFFEGMALQYMVRHLAGRRNNMGGIVYSAADIYFSAITPSATGGQPASAFFMIMDGVSPGITTVILLLNLIMYTAALMVVGLFVMIVQPTLFLEFDLLGRILIIIGYVILIVLAISFMLLLKKEEWIRKIVDFLLRIGARIHLVRREEHLREKVNDMIMQYKECVEFVKGKWRLLFIVFLFNLLQRLFQVSVSVFVYLAQGGMLKYAFHVFRIQILTCIGSNSVPIPGAMGAADYLLISGLSYIPGIQSIANMELMSRGISFYLCVFLSLILMILGYLRRKNMKRKR